MKRSLSYILLLAFMFNVLLAPDLLAAAANPMRLDVKTTVAERVYDNGIETVRNKKGGFVISGKLGEVKDAEDAEVFLAGKKQLLKAQSNAIAFKIKKITKDELGMTHYKAQQYYNGIQVYGRAAIVHTDSKGVIKSVNGSALQDFSINTVPKITGENAIEIAKKAVGAPKELKVAGKIGFREYKPKESYGLVIYSFNNQTYLTYVVELGYRSPKASAWKVFVDAATGKVINKFDRLFDFTREAGYGYGYNDQAHTNQLPLKIIKDDDGLYKLIQKTRPDNYQDRNVILTYDYYTFWSSLADPYYPDTDGIYDSPGQEIGVDAHYNADIVYNYFNSNFKRNSWDGLGSPIWIATNDTDNPLNAYWDPIFEDFCFGGGDGVSYGPFSSALDLVAHEYTHAITDVEAGLEYQGETGALSESFSDVFASIIDPDWQIGEDIKTPGIPGDAERDLSNPALYGQPAHMNDYVNTSDDNGGVHINSGIPNKAFYNIASQIGRDKAAKIYYRALTNYLIMDSDFLNAKYALLLAAWDLYGLDGTEFKAVAYGWGAVGLVDLYDFTLSPGTANLTIGTPQTLTAALEYDDGSSSTECTGAVWSSSKPAVVTVDQTGQLTPLAKGTAVITVLYQGLKATAQVTVTPAVTDLKLDTTAVSLILGASPGRVKATAYYNDGTKADVTKIAGWSISDGSFAGVNLGTITPLAKGLTTLTVDYKNLSASIPVKVTPPVTTLRLSGTSLNNNSLNLTIGDAVYLDAIADYNDSTTEAVTNTAVWKAANPKIVTVTNGQITAIGKGKTSVSAEFNRKRTTVTVEVTPVVDYLEVDKSSVAVVIGGAKAKIKLTAYYIDGTKADVSRAATWTSGNEDFAAVQTGTVTGKAKGETFITAEYKDQSLIIPVKVTPQVLSLTSDKTSLDLITGNSDIVVITAHYNDGSDEDVTSAALWRSSSNAVASASGGTITPVVKGKATITAEFNRKRVSIKVAVIPPVDSIAFDKDLVNMIIGKSAAFKATADYNDGTSADVTKNPSVTWTSSDSAVVTVTSGALKAMGKGMATITASYKGRSYTGNVKVTPALTSLTPDQTTVTLSTGGTDATIVLEALYVDSTTEDVKQFAKWTSSNSKVVTVTGGTITSVGSGTASVYAEFGGKRVTIKVIVS